MNLKGFKKTHDDHEKAILKNDKGHSIILAKKCLSPAYLKSLDNLPIHAAEGADIEQALNDQANVRDEVLAKDDALPEQTLAPQPTAPPPTAPAAPEPEAPAQDAAPQPDAAQPEPDQRQQATQQYNMDHATEMGIQDAKFAQDLQNGHIEPKTYSDLFASKGTMGKVGTLFGLLMSGAGSGLSHQPNAVLEMMNKEISNDLDAQKQSKANAQNFYRLNQQNELNKANISKMKKEGRLTEAQTSSVAGDALLKADNHTKNQMEISMLHNLQTGVDRLPPGQTKAQAQASLNGVGAAAGAQMQQRNIQTGKALSVSQESYEGRTNQMRQLGILNPAWETQAKDRESKEIPGVGASNTPVERETKDRVKKIKEFQGLLNEYETLGKKVGWRGRFDALSPSERVRATGIRNDLISSYNDVKGLTRFTGNEEQLYKDIVPNIGSLNMTGSQLGLLHRLRTSIGQKYDQELTSSGVKPFSDAKQESSPQTEEGATGTYRGKPVVFKGGKWGYR